MKPHILYFVMFSSCLSAAFGADRQSSKLFFYQVAPMQTDTYVMSTQIKTMRQAFLLARHDYELNHQKCDLVVDERLSIPDEQDLYRLVKDGSQKSGRKAIIGITRSNFARLAATASKGSDLRGISSACFSDELKSINPYFITVSDSWEKQWKVSYDYMRKSGCDKNNTIGVFSFADVLGKYYRTAFMREGYSQYISPDELAAQRNLKDIKCVYMGTSLPASVAPLSFLRRVGWTGVVVGMGDWTFYTPEMKAFLNHAQNRKFRIFAPLVWEKMENKRVQSWIVKNFPDREIEPITVAVYDSVIIAMNYLCRGKDSAIFDAEQWRDFGLLRDYSGMAPTGNLHSPMSFVEIK